MTEDRVARAHDVLHTAILEYEQAREEAVGDTLLSDWAIVSAWLPNDENDTTRYQMAYSGRKMPIHLCVGLFQTALHCLQSNFFEPDSEES